MVEAPGTILSRNCTGNEIPAKSCCTVFIIQVTGSFDLVRSLMPVETIAKPNKITADVEKAKMVE